MATAPPAAEHRKPQANAGGKQAAPAAGKDTPQAGAKPVSRAAEPDKQASSGSGKHAPAAGGAQQVAGASKSGAPAKSGAGPGNASGAAQPSAPSASGQRFDRMAVRAKLAVSEPGDAVEREADRVADQVMRAPASDKKPSAGGGAKPAASAAKPPQESVARAAEPPQAGSKAPAAGGTGKTAEPTKKDAPAAPEVKRQADRKDPPTPVAAAGIATEQKPAKHDAEVQRKTTTPAETGQPAADRPGTTQELAARLGAGMPLDAATRAHFESRLGHDLSAVRIHTDDAAAQAAAQLAAKAFTFGNHIAFAAGQYQPDSEGGKRLIAHELAHVLQNDDYAVRNVVRREADPRFKDPNDIGEGAIDPAKHKAGKAALESLSLPAIKSRHAGLYQGLAGTKKLKRPKGYDRDKPEFSTKQVPNWKAGVDVSGKYAEIGFDKSKTPIELPFFGNKNVSLKGTPGEVEERLKIPNWTPDGMWQSAAMQVDHMVEVQVGGADAIGNYELLTGKHNTNVGSLLRAVIYANVKNYLRQVDKNTGDEIVKKYLQTYDVVFEKVSAGGEGKNLEGTSQFWSEKQIQAGEQLKWLKPDPEAAKKDGDKDSFALFSPTGNALIQVFPRKGTAVTIADKGRISGITMQAIALNDGFDSAAHGAQIGTLTATWSLPKSIDLKEKGDLAIPILKIGVKKYGGAMGNFPGALSADLKGASPVSFNDISVLGTAVVAEGTLKPTIPFLEGIEIPVQWKGDDVTFSFVIPIEQLKGKVPVKGLTIDDASLTLFFGNDRFGAEGAIQFTIANLGAGELAARVESKGGKPSFGMKGWIEVDRKLFDKARLELWYSTDDGFGGKGLLEITQKGKIKGVKSARVEAGYAKNEFWAKGGAEPDIPGLKKAEISVSYKDETLAIAGDVGLDEKVPGVRSANIHVEVKKTGAEWKVSASGTLEPNIPPLSGAKLTATYDDGFFLIEGTLDFKKGPLSGTVTAGVTNADVDPETGKRAGKGEGTTFHVFGNAKLNAKLTDKIGGTVLLRIKPDGSILVGGELTVADIELFPQIPDEKSAKRNLLTIKTPDIPLVGITVAGVGVAIVFYATGSLDAEAAVGPGTLKNTKLTIEPFDPVKFDIDSLKLKGSTDLTVPAKAGISLDARANVALKVVVAEIGGNVGIKATAGIPPEPPLVRANAEFTWSREGGFDISSKAELNFKPTLKFELKGELFAKLNVIVDTITVWRREWPLGEASFNLPLDITASASFGYGTKTGLRFDPAKDIVIPKPKLEADDFKSLLDGKPSTQTVASEDKQGRPVNQEAKVGPPEPNMSVPPANASGPATAPVSRKADKPTGAPARERPPGNGPGSAAPAAGAATQPQLSEETITELGPGEPLDIATRGFFEQRMGADFSMVRIHLGPIADRAARRIAARAFTIGSRIVFAEGAFNPESEEGKTLIAHELVHVQQQEAGATRSAMRNGATPPAATAGAGAGASTAPAAAAAPAAAGAGGGPSGSGTAGPPSGSPSPAPELTIPSLRLPQFKADIPHRHSLYEGKRTGLALFRPTAFDRGETAQSATWMRETDVAGALSKITGHIGSQSRPEPYLVRPKRATRRDFVVGTPAELAQTFKRPVWNRSGQWKYFHVDHIVELQVNGTDAIDNMELLEAGANVASGRDIRSHIEDDLNTWLRTHGATLPEAERSPRALKRSHKINFTTFSGAYAPGEADYWKKTEIDAGDHVDFSQRLDIFDPLAPNRGGAFARWPRNVQPEDFTGSPTRVVIYPRETGGLPKGIDWPPGQEGDTRPVDDRTWIPGFHLQSVTFRTAGTDANVGSLRGQLFADNPRLAFNGIRVEIPITRKSGLPYAGFISVASVRRQITSIFNQEGVADMSPATILDFDIDGEKGAVLRGQIRPSLGLIRNSTIDFVIEGDDLRAEKTFNGNELALGGPFRILGSDLTIALGTRSGLSIEGGADFEIERLGTGRIGAGARASGFVVTGSFNFDRRLFDADASIHVTYARTADAPDGKLSGEGDITIGPNKIRGVRRANVHARFDGDVHDIRGSADLSIPGVESASLGASFGGPEGVVITGNARFRDRPGIRGGQIAVTLRQRADGWHVGASGSAEATFAGINATLAASYDDGLFKFSAEAPFNAGPASGRVLVGVTNGSVDEQGNVTGNGEGATELRAFGSGTVTVRLTDWLQGGVGVRIRPDGTVLVSGRIGIPASVRIFGQYPEAGHDRRTLFSMPTISIPLLGAPGVGVTLNISGGVDGYAHIGPGLLTEAEINVIDYNPAQPDSLRVNGRAAFDVGGAAGVDARLDAGLAAGAVISLEAGLGVSAGVGVEAHVHPAVNLEWRPATGLHLHADLAASLSPKLKFDVHGYARVIAGALGVSFELWRKDWQLAQREIGSSLTLGMNAPVDYYSDARGVVFDPNRVTFQVPTLNADTLSQLMNDNGQSTTQRGEGRPPA